MASTPFASPSPGVSESLARQRVAEISEVRYDLVFNVPEILSEPVQGSISIELSRKASSRPLVLDFQQPPESVLAVRVDGTLVEPDVTEGHIVLPPEVFAMERTRIQIDFIAGDGPLHREEEYLYTLFVPDRAEHAFPCLDQPDLKGRFRLRLSLPPGWLAVSNGAEQEVREESEKVIREFAATEPISTYLFAFAAGKFEVREKTSAGRVMRLFHRETDPEKVNRNGDAIFALHASALQWMERYTQIDYPFGKFDFVLIPSFPYGGMEHPGAIFYRASSLLLDESATQVQELGRASVIAHETAHMWFGDLVTMRWFDDVWLKEVFANFMAAKIVHPEFPNIDHQLRFLLSHHPAAYSVDRSAGANAIGQPLGNLMEAGSLYGAIIYNKAPVVMNQLELLLGEETLADGLREYLRIHRFGNATWSQLVDLLDRRTPLDLKRWSRVWVQEPGRPAVRCEIVSGSEGDATLLRVVQRDPAEKDRVWSQHLEVGGIREGQLIRFPVQLHENVTEVEVGAAGRDLDAILPSSRGLGYGHFEVDPKSREYLLRDLPEVTSDLARAAAWLSLWEAFLEGGIGAPAIADLALRCLEAESIELLVERIATDFETVYWLFLLPSDRDVLAARAETALWRRVDESQSTSLKAALFGTYSRIVLTEAGVEKLRKVFSEEIQIEGLPLSERDFMSLALELAIRLPERAEEILDFQRNRIQDPERRDRFEFVRKAVSAEPAVREAFFERLREKKHRRREPWVLEGLRYLHHPVRAADSAKFVRSSLELLEEIQSTGDIFFPKRWLDVTLSGHRSAEVAREVRGFLESRPKYPVQLRAKILQAADLLFRASAHSHGGRD